MGIRLIGLESDSFSTEVLASIRSLLEGDFTWHGNLAPMFAGFHLLSLAAVRRLVDTGEWLPSDNVLLASRGGNFMRDGLGHVMIVSLEGDAGGDPEDAAMQVLEKLQQQWLRKI